MHAWTIQGFELQRQEDHAGIMAALLTFAASGDGNEGTQGQPAVADPISGVQDQYQTWVGSTQRAHGNLIRILLRSGQRFRHVNERCAARELRGSRTP